MTGERAIHRGLGRQVRPRAVARHLYGTGPHLRHCAELAAVGTRLAERHQARAGRIPAGAVLLLLVASFTAVSGWLAASGAVAFADMIKH